MKVTGEFDFIVGTANEKNEFEIWTIFECKNSSTSVQSDIRKKIESMRYLDSIVLLIDKFLYRPKGERR